MKNVHPLHIFALIAIILVFLLIQVRESRDTLQVSKTQYKEVQALASELQGLQKAYGDRQSVEKSLATILKQRSLRGVKIQQTATKNGIRVEAKSMDKRALESLMSKILNGAYPVHSLDIKALSPSKVSFTMEIAC